MHSIRAIFGITLLMAVLALTACGGGDEEQRNVMTNPVVEGLADKLLDTLQAGDYEQLVGLYHASFFSGRAPEAWVDELKAIMVERGSMQSHILRRSQADTRFSGKFYILEYETVHDGNKRLHHLLTIVSPVEGGELRLVGHKITPWEREG